MPKKQAGELNQEGVSGEILTPAAATKTEELLGSKAATVVAIGLGVALIEVELIPGMLIGVAAMLVPNLLPRMGRALRPLLRTTVRASYGLVEKTRETVAEASENIQDIVAEVRSEHSAAAAQTAAPSAPKEA